MIVGGHGDVNPNSSWLNGKGLWLSYGLGVLLLHLILLSLPFLSTAVAWTLTNLIHNLVLLYGHSLLYFQYLVIQKKVLLNSNPLYFLILTVYVDIPSYIERSAVRTSRSG